MEFQSVCHRSSDNYCYPLDQDNLIVNLKTGKDISRVFLYYGDPFLNGIMGSDCSWQGAREEIIAKKELPYHTWWTITVQPKYKRCRYYFELQTEDEIFFYGEDGFHTLEAIEKGKQPQYFTFPWMNSSDINVVPKWVNETTWYQIFPERFCNGDSNLNKEGTLPWASPDYHVQPDEFYGGDLRGIINKLPYLKALHISGIYLTPINESPSTHKYDTINYFKVDPYFGDTDTMKELVKTAHDLGIKVMLDGVFNHSGGICPQWQDVVEKGPSSPYYDWFMVNEWPFVPNEANATKGRFYAFAFHDNMPKFNTNNQEVRDYLIGICEYWVKTYDVDGIRLDVANEISHCFCKELRRRLKALKPDIYILGEIWSDAMSWLRGDEFDAVMNYPLRETLANFWLDETQDKTAFKMLVNSFYTLYMQQTNDVIFNLLDSHDTARIYNRIKDEDKVFQQLIMLVTMPGSPCLYYGTEVLLDGGHDPDCRRCMPWKEIEAGEYDERLEVIGEILKLRSEEALCRSSQLYFTDEVPNPRVLEYVKYNDTDNEQLKVILNCSKETIDLTADGKVVWSRYFKDNKLASNGILIIKIKK